MLLAGRISSYVLTVCDTRRVLTECLAQDVFVGATFRAATGQLAVDHNSRQAPDAVLLRAGRDALLVHIVDLNSVVRTCDSPDHIDRFLAGRAPGAKDFDFVFLGHNPFSFTVRVPR
jgi:hypothetical protein